MLFCGATQQNINNVATPSITAPKDMWDAAQASSVLEWTIRDFTIGQTYYRFIKPVSINWISSDGDWLCYITDLGRYAGTDKGFDRAYEELKLAIHVDFQRLERKRPFEMDESERVTWLELTSVIDLLHYKMTTPLETREIGQVSFEKISRPCSIKWINGQKYIIDPYKVPGELMSCKPSQWIEAIVKRDPITQREIGIKSVNKISFRIPQESEVKVFLDGLPKAELKSAEWTW